MVIKRTPGEKIFDAANYLIMTALLIVFIYPLYYCLCASLSDGAKLMVHSGLLLYPAGFSLKSYEILLLDRYIPRAVFNTVFYVVAGTLISLLMTTMAAYVLSRKRYALKKALLYMIVIPMYFSGGLIPFYIVVKIMLQLGDTIWAVLLPSAVNSFYIFIMVTYFKTLPDSLEESAYIDGANEFTILFRIIVPISMPVIAVMIVYYGVGQWNSWFNAGIFLSLRRFELQPLQLQLRDILLQNSPLNLNLSGTDFFTQQQYKTLIKFSLIMLTVAPIILIYPMVQKYFVKGVMIGSMKD